MKIAGLLMSAVMAMNAPVYGESNGQKMFDGLKSLAGTWQGRMSTSPKSEGVEGTLTTVTMRVTSMGNVLMHEMVGEGRPDDPITMMYLDGERLALTHYCDAGNRPRMVASMSEDGKSVEFDFLDVAGPTTYGYMREARFTLIDAEHHIQEWRFMRPGDKPVVARVELRRVGGPVPAPAAAGAHNH